MLIMFLLRKDNFKPFILKITISTASVTQTDLFLSVLIIMAHGISSYVAMIGQTVLTK